MREKLNEINKRQVSMEGSRMRRHEYLVAVSIGTENKEDIFIFLRKGGMIHTI